MPNPTPHADCDCDICWPILLENAGGPTEVTEVGIQAAVLDGTISLDGFDFERLEAMTLMPIVKRYLALSSSVRYGGGRSATDKLAFPPLRELVVELVLRGVSTPEGFARLLDTTPDRLPLGRFRQCLMAHAVASGATVPEVRMRFAGWGGMQKPKTWQVHQAVEVYAREFGMDVAPTVVAS